MAIVVNLMHHLQLIALFLSIIMNVLQVNIQSVNTSIALLKSVVEKYSVDLVLLQEVWSPKPNFSLPKFQQPIIRSRPGNRNGGGVAILGRNNLKLVHHPEFERSGLEAVWVESILPNGPRILFGSIYINVGKVKEIHLLDNLLETISAAHPVFVLCMDSNSRNLLWDKDTPIGSSSSKSKKMGNAMVDLITKHNLFVHNSGESTYISGKVSSGIDISLSSGLASKESVSWSILQDDLSSPHSGLLLKINEKPHFSPTEVINWDIFDWEKYGKVTKIKLEKLILLLNSSDTSPVQDVSDLISCLHDSVSEIATMKTVTRHSRPWIDAKSSRLIDSLRAAKKRYKRHRSSFNLERLNTARSEASDALNTSRYTNG